ncbi:MAG: FAD-dependent oxidoreductase [Planctomycetota bacterium]|nr:FAD-dependent oxidoreductase [Planctomycetota bacterium]
MYLSNLGSKINIVHRRDELRAQDILQRRAFERDNINFIWDTVPLEILGDDKGVTGIRVKNKKTGEESEHSCEAVFVFIGLLPETDVKGLEVVEKDEDGFIVADNMMRTNVPGVYVAGDIRKDNPRQIAIATGDGCIASYSAEERNNNLEFPEWED